MRKELILVLFLVLITAGCSKSEKVEEIKEKEMQKKIVDSFEESNRTLNEHTRKTVEALDKASTNDNTRLEIQ